MSIFKTHKAHINEIKGAIRFHNAPVYFHGDGNIYPVTPTNLEQGQMNPSDFRLKNSNPKKEEATYRVKFNSIAEVPGTVEEINDLLIKSKEKERQEQQKVTVSGGVQNFAAYEDEPEEPKLQPAEETPETEETKPEKPGKGKGK